MSKIHDTVSVLAILSMAQACRTEASAPADPPEHATRLAYPAAPHADVVDDYHGQRVADPFRPLEDPDAPATRAWIDAQNRITRAWIAECSLREPIEQRMTELWNYERFGVPEHTAGRYFFSKNDGLQNQAVLYVADGLEGGARVLLDPNSLRADGTVALMGTELTHDGRYLAYALSEAGSDWQTVRVRDIDSGQDLDDRVQWVKFSNLAWSKDGRGFFYSTYPDHDTSGTKPLKHHELRYHALGTPQSADRLVCSAPDQPDLGFSGRVTHDGEYLVIHVWQGTEQRNRVYIQDLRFADAPVQKLCDEFDAEYDFLGKHGTELYFKTDLDAPRGRVIAIDLAQPTREHWRAVVPQTAETIESALVAGGRIVVCYMKDAFNELRVFERDGRAHDTLALPGLGSVATITGRADDDEVYFAFSSFTTPTSIYGYRVATKKLAVVRAPRVAFRPEDYVTRQVFVTSKDGTRVPMFVSHHARVKPSATTPTLLYGYGGFNVPMKPSFHVASLVWMEMGGLFAVPCLRGGGEYGREWHEAGTKARKQNVFDDFIACAEWLVREGYTSTPSLAIRGGSNGGLLVGACMTQRPELFGAALPAVGVLDMLRYHRFTIGWGWASDYGTADDAALFDVLRRYSPLHNVKEGVAYPPTMITTGDHDDRVVPAHSFKFAAALQRAQAGANPILIRIETRGGHGAGKPTAMQIEEFADQWAFLARVLRMPDARGASSRHAL
ncbi:MAG: prolyl oligopeptidase family serine peptidase [Planctomycetota bacterium]